MQAFQDRYVLLVDTSEMDSARSDVSETVNEFVRRPGSGRRKTHIPWRSPWDASVCTVFADLPASCSPLKPPAPAASGATPPAATPAAAGAADCLTPYSGTAAHTPTPGGGPRRGKSKQELIGPCCHCGVANSPQWRKGPKGKPILCNACGIRFLRTRSLGKVTPKKRRSPVTAAASPSPAVAKRLKLDDMEDTEEEGRTSSGVEDALEDAPPPEAETEEPTDELQEDMMALHSSLQAAAAAVKLEQATAAAAAALPARPAASGVAGAGAGASAVSLKNDDEATGGSSVAAFVAAIKQQQAALLAHEQQAAASAAVAQLAMAQQQALLAHPPLGMLATASPAVLQALGFAGAGAAGTAAVAQVSPGQLRKREGQGSAPSSPLVGPLALPAAMAALPSTNGGAAPALAALPGLDAASLRLLLSGMLPGGALAGGVMDDGMSVVVQRSRSKGPATSTKTV